MKKIMIIIPWFDPAYRAGGPVRSIVNMVKAMNGLATFHIFTGDKDVDGSKLAVSEKNAWVDYDEHVKVWYNDSPKPFKNLKKEVNALKPDVVFIIGLFDYVYNILPVFLLKHSHKIVSVRGMLHPGALSQKPLKKRLFLSLLKSSGVLSQLAFHATDATESQYIKNILGSKQKIHIAENFPRDIGQQQREANSQSHVLRLLSIGLISPMKNHLLILEALKKTSLSIEYTIAGAVKDHQYWQDCQACIKSMPVHVSVRYNGEVEPHTVEGLLKNSDLFILPSKSENYGHAIIEALFCAVPVITSHHTPWNELRENKAGINIDLTPTEILNALHFFTSMSELELNEWRDGARNYAMMKTDKTKIVKQYQSMFA
jgi:glycosyltransferase involved in cell wall biosynthesis